MHNLLILWDWDNTLMDTSGALFHALEDTMNHYGLPKPTEQDLNEVLSHHKGAYWENLFPGKVDEAFNYGMSRFAIYHKESVLFENSFEIIKYVYELGIPQMILSNKPQDLLDDEVSRVGIRPFVLGVVGTDYVLPDKKPMPHFGQNIINTIAHRELMMIGDGEADVEYAKAIGALSVYIQPAHVIQSNLKPDYRFNNLSEVFMWLKKYLKNK